MLDSTQHSMQIIQLIASSHPEVGHLENYNFDKFSLTKIYPNYIQIGVSNLEHKELDSSVSTVSGYRLDDRAIKV
jgi:hypothetical protein